MSGVEEKQLLEKIRQGEEGFEEEEQPKRLEVGDEDEVDDDDDDADPDFSDYDSNDEKSGRYVETALGNPDGFKFTYNVDKDDQEEEDERNCLEEFRCSKFQHSTKFEVFVGVCVYELFKVTLSLEDNDNDKNSISNPLEGSLYGAIVMEQRHQHVNPPRISYYSVSKKDASSITLFPGKIVHLPLSGPEPRPPLADLDYLDLTLALKFRDQDLFKGGSFYENSEIFNEDRGAYCRCVSVYTANFRATRKHGPYVALATLGPTGINRIIIRAYFSIFFGVWASVDVRILKKGVKKIFGSIYARPCIFRSRSRLLSIQPDDEKLELEEDGFLKLTRSIVAVPSYSSLIIAAVLYDQDGQQIFHDKTFFAPSKKGDNVKHINGEDGVPDLEVTVKWTWKPVKWT